MAADALIVLAHPGRLCLSRTFAHDAQQALVAKSLSVRLLDLYAEGFDPRLTAAEREAYYADAPDTAGIGAEAAMLENAQTLVLVFPTWWFGMPAILKGWIDRVFAPGVAFDHASNFGPIKPGLTNLGQVLVITTLGAPAWIDWLVMRRPVRRILKTAIFGLCAPQARFDYLSLYAAEKPEKERVDAFRARIARALS